MPWGTTEMRREVKEEKKVAVHKGKSGVFYPPKIEIRQRRVTGGRIGLGEAVVRT